MSAAAGYNPSLFASPLPYTSNLGATTGSAGTTTTATTSSAGPAGTSQPGGGSHAHQSTPNTYPVGGMDGASPFAAPPPVASSMDDVYFLLQVVHQQQQAMQVQLNQICLGLQQQQRFLSSIVAGGQLQQATGSPQQPLSQQRPLSRHSSRGSFTYPGEAGHAVESGTPNPAVGGGSGHKPTTAPGSGGFGSSVGSGFGATVKIRPGSQEPPRAEGTQPSGSFQAAPTASHQAPTHQLALGGFSHNTSLNTSLQRSIDNIERASTPPEGDEPSTARGHQQGLPTPRGSGTLTTASEVLPPVRGASVPTTPRGRSPAKAAAAAANISTESLSARAARLSGGRQPPAAASNTVGSPSTPDRTPLKVQSFSGRAPPASQESGLQQWDATVHNSHQVEPPQPSASSYLSVSGGVYHAPPSPNVGEVLARGGGGSSHNTSMTSATSATLRQPQFGAMMGSREATAEYSSRAFEPSGAASREGFAQPKIVGGDNRPSSAAGSAGGKGNRSNRSTSSSAKVRAAAITSLAYGSDNPGNTSVEADLSGYEPTAEYTEGTGIAEKVKHKRSSSAGHHHHHHHAPQHQTSTTSDDDNPQPKPTTTAGTGAARHLYKHEYDTATGDQNLNRWARELAKDAADAAFLSTVGVSMVSSSTSAGGGGGRPYQQPDADAINTTAHRQHSEPKQGPKAYKERRAGGGGNQSGRHGANPLDVSSDAGYLSFESREYMRHAGLM